MPSASHGASGAKSTGPLRRSRGDVDLSKRPPVDWRESWEGDSYSGDKNLSMVLWIIGLESTVVLTENHHLPKCPPQAHRLVRVQIDKSPRSKNCCGKQNGEFSLLCHFIGLYVALYLASPHAQTM